MNKKIAIEPNLTQIKNFLTNKGFQVESIDYNWQSAKTNLDKYDAIIVTGQNSNFIGMEDTLTKSTIIDASGLTPQQVFTELQNKI